MTDIRHELHLSAAPDKAYAAVATEKGIHGWWTKDGAIGANVGDPVTLRFQKGDQSVTMRFTIEELKATEVVRWRCVENANPVWVGTELRFEVAPEGDGTTLTLTHSGFEESGSPPYQMTVEGWAHFMSSLEKYVDTGEGMPAGG